MKKSEENAVIGFGKRYEKKFRKAKKTLYTDGAISYLIFSYLFSPFVLTPDSTTSSFFVNFML